MLKIITLACSAMMLNGCNHLTISNFERSKLSAVSGNKAGLITQQGVQEIPQSSPLAKYIKVNNKISDEISSACKTEGQKITPIAVPVISAIGKLIFDLQMDKSTKELKKLKEAARATFSQRVILPSEDFNQHTCAIIYRYDPVNNDIGFISVIKFDKYGDAFTITPKYIKAHNTVAITKKPDDEKEYAKIDASIAVSIKAIGKEKNGLPSLSSIGEGVVTIPNIEVSENGSNPCTKECDSSDLIPGLSSGSQYISVTFSVIETGKLGVDLDEKIAEYMAIKEAIGPAIGEGIKEHYKED
jgi:hypothetical protein